MHCDTVLCMNIRPATATDYKTLFAFTNELLKLHVEIDTFYQQIESYDDWFAFISKQDMVFVAEDAREVVGAAIGQFIDKPKDRRHATSLLRNIYVVPAYRQKGVGRLLTTAFEAEAQSRGAAYCEIHVDVRNVQAIAFWDESGYETYQVRKRKRLV